MRINYIKKYFLIAIVSLLFGCQFKYDIAIQKKQLKDKVPNAQLFDFSTSFLRYEIKKWELFAKQALFYNADDLTILSNLSLVNYDPNGVVISQVKANSGILDNKTKNITLQENAVMSSSNGTTLYGNSFYWDNQTELLTSTEKVTLIRSNGDIQTGIGMKADKSLETVIFYKVTGNVDGSSLQQ